MKRSRQTNPLASALPWLRFPQTRFDLPDVLMLAAGLALFYGIISIARTWFGPLTPQVAISRSPWSLPIYAGFSLLRVTLAYALSLAFTVVYGYLAAYNPRAEPYLVALLDVLQSIPVLSFLPGVMLAMVELFPTRQLGLEFGSILLIFTGQVWNMAFSFYASLKSVPHDMREAAKIYRFSRWQRFTQVELPFAAIGLVWNSMMSVAGGWFFLMACEMFVLGKRDFRLPGLGSYLQTAASAGDTPAILWGLTAMVTVIVLLDQFVWRPVIAWAEKFKVEQVESSQSSGSWMLDLLRGSRFVGQIRRSTFSPIREHLLSHFARRHRLEPTATQPRLIKTWSARLMGAVMIALVCYGAVLALLTLVEMNHHDLIELLTGTGATFLRVTVALLLGTVWTVPAGVAIGFHPKIVRIFQPLVQIAASVPATALFPVVMLLLIRIGGGLGIGSVVLLLLGTQWYILFNVIAGAMAIPTELREASRVFHIEGLERWRKLILPGIFPYLITGLITASGGAWNASIVAEYFHFGGQTFSTIGLGSTISQATDAGDLDLLVAATVAMAGTVVVINRVCWRRLYGFAQSRFRLEA